MMMIIIIMIIINDSYDIKTKLHKQWYDTNYVDDLVQDHTVSIANTSEILHSCTNPSKYSTWHDRLVIYVFALSFGFPFRL